MVAGEHRLAPLVENADALDNLAEARPLGVRLRRRYLQHGVDGVADEYRLREPQALVPIGEGMRVDLAGGEADADREGHRAMGDALAEVGAFHELRIEMVREEVAAVAGMNHEIGL